MPKLTFGGKGGSLAASLRSLAASDAAALAAFASWRAVSIVGNWRDFAALTGRRAGAEDAARELSVGWGVSREGDEILRRFATGFLVSLRGAEAGEGERDIGAGERSDEEDGERERFVHCV